jgi:hypothetical protein
MIASVAEAEAERRLLGTWDLAARGGPPQTIDFLAMHEE